MDQLIDPLARARPSRTGNRCNTYTGRPSTYAYQLRDLALDVLTDAHSSDVDANAPGWDPVGTCQVK